MTSGIYRVPTPLNEPVYSFAPGSQERKAQQDALSRAEAETIQIPLVIDGQHLGTDSYLEHRCPHQHKKVTARLANADAKQIKGAIDASCRAANDWSRFPWQERAAIFLKAADLLATKYRFAINAQTMVSQSKTVVQAEIDAACELIDFFRFNAFYMERIYSEQPLHSPRGQWNRSEARGLEGFVLAIGPFNFTSISVNLATAPAMMGCGVVWKPSHQALPASYIALLCLEEAGLPPGVINLVHGASEQIGQMCFSDPRLAGVHFTGSTRTFNHIWKTVAANVDNYRSYPRLVGETGGKDFIFVHPSADIDGVVTALVRGSFEYQGQKCSAASRAYIPQSLWAKMKDRLIAETNSLTMGSPSDFKNFMSAVIDEKAFSRIKGFIDEAKSSPKADIIAGGQCDDKEGYFIRPTIIEAHDPYYRSMVEEIFGPVLTVFVYKDAELDQILDVCDRSTVYALTGAIFANDRRAIHYMSDKLRHAAGNFYINDKPTGAVVGQQPFGGSRASGTNDKAGSPYNLLRWASHRTIKETFVPFTSIPYPHMD